MIEIGRRSPTTLAVRRASEALGGMSFILGVVWIARGFLGIPQFSVDILLAGFGLTLLGRILQTKTNAGAARAATTFLWNLAATAIIIIVAIWILGWIATLQGDVFPSVVSTKVPYLVIAAVTTGLGAYAADKFAPRRSWSAPSRPAFLVPEGKGPATEGLKLATKRDAVGLPVKRDGKSIGCVLRGDLFASFETPMGPVTASLLGPVTTLGIPFQGEVIPKAQVTKLTGRTPEQLVDETRADRSVWNPSRTEGFELPFIHMWKDDFESEAVIGPIRMTAGPSGESVKIGPIIIDSDSKDHPKKWLAKGAGDSYVRLDGDRVSAKWNGSSLSMSGGSMKLSVGSDSFSYSPTEVTTSTPLHTLRVTKDKVTLDTRKFTLQLSGDTVVLRTEDKTSSTESKEFADDLRGLLTDVAERQVKDVMEGTPIDMSEMLTETEEVLAKHG